ncbi:MAG TPA: hypothetical protein PLX31_14800, partial [Gemmatimonadaceae bacterium]|nr:hypothetical protein [Gemmatimonadaceae bacterium]
MRDVAATGTALRIRAGGTWLDAGRPVASGLRTLDVGALRGIVEYVPGDLTLTARRALREDYLTAVAHPSAFAAEA